MIVLFPLNFKKHIEFLKFYRDKYTLFSVINTLIKHIFILLTQFIGY
jgi:hypothetical protein